MIGFKTVTCPRCRHYLMVSSYLSFWRCGICGKWFDYTELMPGFKGIACLENPKSHRHPDWIEQDESLALMRYMGVKI
jgi:ribosomal protein S27AE